MKRLKNKVWKREKELRQPKIPIGVISKVILSMWTNRMICTRKATMMVDINRGDFRQFKGQTDTPRCETNTVQTPSRTMLRVLWHFEAFVFYCHFWMMIARTVNVECWLTLFYIANRQQRKKQSKMAGSKFENNQVEIQNRQFNVGKYEKCANAFRHKLLINKHSQHYYNNPCS